MKSKGYNIERDRAMLALYEQGASKAQIARAYKLGGSRIAQIFHHFCYWNRETDKFEHGLNCWCDEDDRQDNDRG